MTQFAVLKPKICNYLTNDCYENRNAKGSKKCVIKRKLKHSIIKII